MHNADGTHASTTASTYWSRIASRRLRNPSSTLVLPPIEFS